MQGPKIRKRPESFADHYSQATLFWNSMSDWEQRHMVAAYRFELGKVERMHIRQRVIEHLTQMVDALRAQHAVPELLAAADGAVTAADGSALPVDRAITTMASVLYDAVVAPDGATAAETLQADGYAVHFVAEAYKHAKPLGFVGAGTQLWTAAHLPTGGTADAGVVTADGDGLGSQFIDTFLTTLAGHRFNERPVDAVAA